VHVFSLQNEKELKYTIAFKGRLSTLFFNSS